VTGPLTLPPHQLLRWHSDGLQHCAAALGSCTGVQQWAQTSATSQHAHGQNASSHQPQEDPCPPPGAGCLQRDARSQPVRACTHLQGSSLCAMRLMWCHGASAPAKATGTNSAGASQRWVKKTMGLPARHRLGNGEGRWDAFRRAPEPRRLQHPVCQQIHTNVRRETVRASRSTPTSDSLQCQARDCARQQIHTNVRRAMGQACLEDQYKENKQLCLTAFLCHCPTHINKHMHVDTHYHTHAHAHNTHGHI